MTKLNAFLTKTGILSADGKPNKRNIVRLVQTVIVVILLLVILGLLGWKFFGPGSDDAWLLENGIKAKLGQLENKTNAEIQAALDEVIEEGSMNISINMNPVFPSGTAKGSLRIENHPNNHYNQRIVITLDETGEELYSSGLMPVNSHIDEDILEVDLDPGDYDATAVFTAYDVDTDTEVGQAIAKIQISVLT